jgi:hypothetical protein
MIKKSSWRMLILLPETNSQVTIDVNDSTKINDIIVAINNYFELEYLFAFHLYSKNRLLNEEKILQEEEINENSIISAISKQRIFSVKATNVYNNKNTTFELEKNATLNSIKATLPLLLGLQNEFDFYSKRVFNEQAWEKEVRLDLTKPFNKLELPDKSSIYIREINSGNSFLEKAFFYYTHGDSVEVVQPEWVWAQGIIPYVIHDSLPRKSKSYEKLINCLTIFEKLEAINFKEMKPTEVSKDKLHSGICFKLDKVKCYSYVGRTGSQQTIKISEKAKKLDILHCLLHCLGFKHDNTDLAPDVKYKCFKFKKDSTHIAGYPLGRFDKDSVFNSNRISAGTNKIFSSMKMEKKKLSQADINAIKYVYSPPKCSFETFKNEYSVQFYYECYTCFGANSNFGICEYCRYYHHSGHEVKEHAPSSLLKEKVNFICDCAKSGHQTGVCTRLISNKDHTRQDMYTCKSCFDTEKFKATHNGEVPVVCLSCRKKCHNGHRVEPLPVNTIGFCDCGLPPCLTECHAAKFYGKNDKKDCSIF